MTEKQAALHEVVQALHGGERFVICGHVSPDGDCLGSALALSFALRALGKQTTCLLAKNDPLDFALMQLPGMNEAVVAKDYTGSFDTFVTVDVPSAERMGQDAAALHAQAARTITIDHHIPGEVLSQVNYIDEDSPATALLVWDLIAELGIDYAPHIATCCYVGLMTDTGRFQYQNTTADALRGASEMIAAGANPAELAKLIYQNRSAGSLALEERMLGHRELLHDNQFALSHLLISDFTETQTIRADAEDLIDVLRSVRNVRVACLLREQDGCVRGSLRAKDETDVAEIARSIGGGGHKAAAGFTFEGTIEEALEHMRSVFSHLAQA